MKRSLLIGMAGILSVVGCANFFVGTERCAINASQAVAADPLNATYTIEGREIPLLNGRHEVEATPGSATKIRTWVFGEPGR